MHKHTHIQCWSWLVYLHAFRVLYIKLTPAWSESDPYWRSSFITVAHLCKEVWGDGVHAVLQLMVEHGSLCVTCREQDRHAALYPLISGCLTDYSCSSGFCMLIHNTATSSHVREALQQHKCCICILILCELESESFYFIFLRPLCYAGSVPVFNLESYVNLDMV